MERVHQLLGSYRLLRRYAGRWVFGQMGRKFYVTYQRHMPGKGYERGWEEFPSYVHAHAFFLQQAEDGYDVSLIEGEELAN